MLMNVDFSPIFTEKLRAYFSTRKEVVAALLFGSHAQGRQRDDSDVDVGVLLRSEAAPSASPSFPPEHAGMTVVLLPETRCF